MSLDIASMLAEKTTWSSGEPGGWASLKPADLSLAMGGLPAGPTMAVYALVVGDEQSIRKLKAHMTNKAAGMVDCHSAGRLQGLVESSLYEFLHDGNCPECGGKGEWHFSTEHSQKYGIDPVYQCEACHGSGKRRISTAELQRVAGLDSKTWRICRRVHDELYGMLQGYLLDADRAIQRRMEA